MTTDRMRDRVHAAADRIEVPAFDPQAVVAAIPPQRRLPWVPMAVAASVGLALGATAWLAGAGSGEPGPAANTETTTPGALVAIALDHIDAEPSYYEPENRPAGDGVSAAIRFGANGEYDGEQVSLLVGRGDGPDWLECDEYDDGCVTIATPDGDVTLAWQEEEPEEDPGIVSVYQRRDDGFALVGYSGQAILGDPREQTLPVPVEEMVAIVSDPAFGPTTTEEWAQAGEKVDWDYRADEPDPDDGIPPASTPASLAAAIDAHLASEGLAGLIDHGVEQTFAEPGGTDKEGAWGLMVALEGGYALHVNVYAGSGPLFLACQPTLTCWDFEGLTLAGKPGLAGAFRSDHTASVHAWLEGPGIDPQGPADFGLGNGVTTDEDTVMALLAATVRLVNADGVSQFTTQRWLDEAPGVEWLHP